MGRKPSPSAYAFWGHHYSRIITGGRLRLPVAVTHQLDEAGVKKLWLAALPDEKALVMIPPAYWPTWLAAARERWPILRTPQGKRLQIGPSVCAEWDATGRISLPEALRHHAGLNDGTLAIIIGLGRGLEVWAIDPFKEMRNRCGGQPQPAPPSSPRPVGGSQAGAPGRQYLPRSASENPGAP